MSEKVELIKNLIYLCLKTDTVYLRKRFLKKPMTIQTQLIQAHTAAIHQSTVYIVVCSGAESNHELSNLLIIQFGTRRPPCISPINHPYSLTGFIERSHADKRPMTRGHNNCKNAFMLL
ncbi:hypothetical protein D7V95_09600 [bacterium J10(2018)]|jgi:hypothetical protein|nr:hypothetical protein D7V95_09600 [bacterium J10(2018)]